jgi:hypothetical protein
MSNSVWISPATKPSGCADNNNRMILSRGSVPIAENISANFATYSALFLTGPFVIFRYLQKYGRVSSRLASAHCIATLPPQVTGGSLVTPRERTSSGSSFSCLHFLICGKCPTKKSHTLEPHAGDRYDDASRAGETQIAIYSRFSMRSSSGLTSYPSEGMLGSNVYPRSQ